MFALRKNESLFEYWLSFSPAAPLFGVRWRLAPMAPAWAAPFAVAPFASAPTRPEARAPKPEPVEPAAVADAAAKAVTAETAEAEEVAPAEAQPEAPAHADLAFDMAAAQAERARPDTLFEARPESVDDLKQIRGVGPKLETMLNELGVYTYEQIAGFDQANLAWLDSNLSSFKGRPFRDDWVEQARALLGR